MLKIYNTLSKQKEVFTPIHPPKVSLYVCGMTVYDYCHMGHARLSVVFDVVARYFRARGYDLTYVMNITDIDDKIIKRANELGEDYTALTTRFIDAMHEDLGALGVLPPDQQPRATAHIDEIIALIERLIANDMAYVGDNGDVYYRVKEFADYGKLAHKDLDQLRVGARVDVVDAKRDPLDFVLWKQSKPGEPAWASPWGEGRPGWHIECSAMSMQCLGEHFDIHGGGFDLVFPHHQNEVAQSEGATGKQFVNLWMHAGFLTIDQEKMSKSLGNFFTLRDVLLKYPAEVIRYFLLSSHYRGPLNYSDEALDNAQAALVRFYTALRGLDAKPLAVLPESSPYAEHFFAAMDDDFNTAEALAALFDLVREINKQRETDASKARDLAGQLLHLAGILGLLANDPDVFLQAGADGVDAAAIESLIAEREQARAEKNWARADEIRDELAAQGIVLEDAAGGTTWKRG